MICRKGSIVIYEALDKIENYDLVDGYYTKSRFIMKNKIGIVTELYSDNTLDIYHNGKTKNYGTQYIVKVICE